MKPKLDDKGIVGIFVGYPEEHASDVYRMWCPSANGIRLSRDITWLKKSCGKYMKKKEYKITPL